jgi:hypothetical protein
MIEGSPTLAMDLSRFDSGSIEWLFHFCFEQGLPVAVANLLRISNRVSDWWDEYLGGHRRAVLNAAAHSSWVCGHIRLSEAAAFIANKKGGTVVRSQMRLLWEAGKASCEDSPKMMDCLRLVLSHDISKLYRDPFLGFLGGAESAGNAPLLEELGTEEDDPMFSNLGGIFSPKQHDIASLELVASSDLQGDASEALGMQKLERLAEVWKFYFAQS